MYEVDFIRRLESGLKSSLSLWSISDQTQLSLLTVSENATFRGTETGLGHDIVFRVHRPHYHTREEILAELAWIDALRQGRTVETPRPIPLRDGSLVAEFDDEGMTRHVVAFEFVAGREPAPGDDLVGWFAKLGAIHATLHGHAKTWRRPDAFVRKVWNFNSMLGNAPLWGDWRDALGLTVEGREILSRTTALLERQLAEIGEGPDDFGLVHADLRLANLLVEGDRMALIDFDDCGFSWFLYDFASAISFIEHEDYIPALEAAWIEGYRSVAPLSEARAEQLPIFVMLRRILLTAWIASHRETETAQLLGDAYTQGTVALAYDFLERYRKG
ncbi:Ser/Thr protein kinase RdoA (MazF antagonist) [Rhodoligotrophos appendicifer]|uniref:phosphotransferase enzyme family protein n=1 Tax=Rhodoligotrophos appendicifer TaxID=987056 RepID=UPI00117CFA9B|nr:phosphotransferase [Rhodoligotrophos appendicifer]